MKYNITNFSDYIIKQEESEQEFYSPFKNDIDLDFEWIPIYNNNNNTR